MVSSCIDLDRASWQLAWQDKLAVCPDMRRHDSRRKISVRELCCCTSHAISPARSVTISEEVADSLSALSSNCHFKLPECTRCAEHATLPPACSSRLHQPSLPLRQRRRTGSESPSTPHGRRGILAARSCFAGGCGFLAGGGILLRTRRAMSGARPTGSPGGSRPNAPLGSTAT